MLEVVDVAVFGWSLGGHIALEMAPRFPGIGGLKISAHRPSADPTWRRGSCRLLI
jgi:dienelactone hydrolase